MTTPDVFDFLKLRETPLDYASDEALNQMYADTLSAMRLAVARYDMNDARLLNRKLDRIEEEQARRRFDEINKIHNTMKQEGGR